MSLQGKTIFITGGSRGVGRAIALRAAQDGANVIIAAKTAEPHPKLEGTIHTVAQEIQDAGGRALAIQCDVRDENQIKAAIDKAADTFCGIDILINNASAIQLTSTLATEMKKFDLMFMVNVRATYAAIQAATPYLKAAANPHVLTLSPPLNMKAKWFKNHCAYTMSKYGMSMCTLGMAEEFREDGIAFNSLWPETTIATAAANMLGGEALMRASRKPEIMADAAYAILVKDARSNTGNFYVDTQVLLAEGISDFQPYAFTPSLPLMPDFFLD